MITEPPVAQGYSILATSLNQDMESARESGHEVLIQLATDSIAEFNALHLLAASVDAGDFPAIKAEIEQLNNLRQAQ